MDFIDDDRMHGAQNLPASLTGEQEIKRLRRGDQDVRWLSKHPLALAGRRVTRADESPNLRTIRPFMAGKFENLRERSLKIALNIIGQRSQGRDIDDVGLVPQFSSECKSKQRIETCQECRESFSGTGRGRNKRVLPGLNRYPSEPLRLGRGREPALK